MEFHVTLTESAKADIEHFPVTDQRVIATGIITYLKVDAGVETRKRKPLRPNAVATWELRIGDFRVFYTIEDLNTVKVIAVGIKDHNELFIRGTRIDL